MANKKMIPWKIVLTPTVRVILEQMAYCQDNSISRIFIDRPDIGKTVAARHYAKNYNNAFYVDCSQSPTRHKFVRALAKAAGLSGEGKLIEVRTEFIEFMRDLDTPIIMLDEAGHLDYNSWLELISLWNALERQTSWWMQGDDTLKAKIERLKAHQKVGYAGAHRRFGSDFMTVSPKDIGEYAEYFRVHAEMIAKANMPGVAYKELMKDGLNLGKIPLSLDRLRDNIIKRQHEKHYGNSKEGEIKLDLSVFEK